MASQQPDENMLIVVDQLVSAYYDEHPDPSDPGQAVSFGTSGHRGRSLDGTFTEDHIVAISQAIARYREAEGIDGTLFLGLKEVPVGFKRFVGGLLGGSLAFGGEKSAGGTFLRHDGGGWSTDEDGLIMCLLAAEMTARGGKDSGELYAELTGRYDAPVYRRVGTPATPEQKRALGALAPDDVRATELAGEPIAQVLTTAPSCAAGRCEGRDSVRPVPCAPLWDQGCLQTLRRKLRRRTAPRPHSRAGRGTLRQGAGAQ